jgi:hypothetical protein
VARLLNRVWTFGSPKAVWTNTSRSADDGSSDPVAKLAVRSYPIVELPAVQTGDPVMCEKLVNGFVLNCSLKKSSIYVIVNCAASAQSASVGVPVMV